MLPANATKFTFELIGLEDSLRVIAFAGEEIISQPYRFIIDIVSENFNLTHQQFMEKSAVLTLVDDGGDNRLVHGNVVQFCQLGHGDRFASYRLVLVPMCQFMTFKENFRTFQQLSAPDIIKQVLSESAIVGSNVKFSLSNSYPKRPYCVQYGETDLAFVERIMSEEGLFYFFEHYLDHHCMVIGDRNALFGPVPGQSKIQFHEKTGMVQTSESIYSFIHSTKSPKANNLHSVTIGDYTAKNTQLDLAHQVNPEGALEHYRFPGYFETPDEAKHYAQIHFEAASVDNVTGEGQTQCVRLLPGKILEMKQHNIAAFNRRYLLTQVVHEGVQPQSLEEGSTNQGTEYQATFFTMPNETPFRVPIIDKPNACGHQTALVVGPVGEEIYTDSMGRIKVQFHWDRQGRKDDRSSLWIRVAQGFAGNGYGSIVVPRVGQEVVVQFEYGNPDRPIVTGCTNNTSSPHSEKLPFNKTRSVFRSNSSPGGDGHNELRIEDKKGKEQIYLHAEKDLDMRIKNDVKIQVQKDHHHIVSNQQNESTGKDKHLSVGGNRNAKVDGSLSINVSKDMHQKSGNNHVQQAQQTHLKAASQLVIDGGMSMTIKGGAGTLFLSPAGVSITGPMVRINSGGGGGGAQSASPQKTVNPTLPVNDKPGRIAKPGGMTVIGGANKIVTDNRKGAKITLLSDGANSSPGDSSDATQLVGDPLLATPEKQQSKEKDWIKLNLFWDDKHKTPVKQQPYKLYLADGSIREGELDDKGVAFEEQLPKGTVKIEYISRAEEEASLERLRNQLHTTLKNIVADAQMSTDAQNSVADSMSAFEMGLVYVGSAMMGGWDMVTDLASFVSAVGKGLYQANMAYLDLVEDILTGDVREIQRKYEAAEKAGAAAYDIGGDVSEAINLLIADVKTWDILTDFPGDYWDAISGVDATRKAAPIVIELLITIFSMGAGSPLLAVNLSGKAGRLAKEAGELLADIVLGLKNIGRPLKKKSTSNSNAIHKLKPEIEPKRLHKPGDSKAAKTDTGKACPKGKECSLEGEPISMVTGEELLTLDDFVFNGPLPLLWQRVYRTSNAKQRGLGVGWTHPASELLKVTRYMVAYVDAEGRNIPFTRPSVGATVENATEKLSLTCLDSGSFVLIGEGQPDRIFQGEAKLPLVALIDNSGNRLDFHYQTETQQLTRIQSSWGPSLIFQWEKGCIRQIDQLGVDNEITPLVTYRYDDASDLIACVDANQHGEHYAYNNHIITQRTLKTGFNFYFEWDQYTPQARCVKQYGDDGIYNYRFEWDDDNRISRAIDSRGGVKEFHYNGDGKVVKEIDAEGAETCFVFDNNGNLIERIEAPDVVHQYDYDDNGQLVEYRDPAGGGYHVAYDDNRPVKVTDALGSTWARTYNEKGLVEEIIDPEGRTTRYQYNIMGLPIAIEGPSGTSKKLVWNNQGQLIEESINENCTLYQYNRQHQIASVTEIAAGDETQKGESTAQTTEYRYDACGNVQTIRYPDGNTHHLEYNNNDQLTRYTDAMGRTTQYRYDGLAQVRQKIDPLGHVFEYQYDKERNLVGLLNEKGELYELKYDKNERLVEEIGFDGRVQQYRYNTQGHLSAHIEGSHETTAALGRHTTEFHRDVMGRLLEKHSPDGEISQFSYDTNGQLTQAKNQSRDVTFEYTTTGLLAKESQDDHVIEHRYNELGKRTETLLPNNKVIRYQYDRNQRWHNVEFAGKNVVSLQRNIKGQETQRTQGDIATQYDYDVMGRLTQQRSTNQSSKQRVIQRDYQYNTAGNLSVIDDFKKGVTEYHYDSLDRLKAVNAYAEEKFAFDPAGNLLGVSSNEADQTGSAQVKGNRLQFQGDRKFEYDAAGNLTRETRGKGGKIETLYRYNSQNQLKSIQRGNQTTRYRYDALGRRTEKVDEFGKTAFLWNGDVLLSENRNSSEKLYLYEPESFRPLAQVKNGQIFHYHLDHLGTPQEITNQKGGIVWSVQYKAYGNLALKDVDYVENNLRFQGQYFDEESGLHYNRHRYYDPGTARFVNQDPIGLSGGANNYKYVSNPVSWIDPFGLTAKDCSPDITLKFVHGTSTSNAENIMKKGLVGDRAIAAQTGTHTEGSFMAHQFDNFDSSDNGVHAAAGWAGSKHPNSPNSLIVMEIQESTYNKLASNGQVKVGTPPGMHTSHPDEHVFLPASFDVLNMEARLFHVPLDG